MDKLFNRLIYIEIILLAVLSFLIIAFLFTDHIPDVILFSIIDLIAPYDFEAAEKILRKGLLTEFFNHPGLISIVLGLWFVCLILLLKRKKIGIQILYFLVVIELVSILFLGDDIYTPFLLFITVIEAYIIGALIYMVTFSNLKKEFK